MTPSLFANGLPWLAAGMALGIVYFFLLGRGVGAISRAGDWHGAVGFLLLRIGLAAAVFAMAAKQGAPALLFALAGFLIARAIAMARVKRGG